MRGAIFYEGFETERNRAYIDMYFKSCARRGIELSLYLAERLSFGVADGALFLSYDGAPVKTPDFAVMRLREPLLTSQLEKMGVKTFNASRVCALTNDKRRTYRFAQELGLPVMDTWFVLNDSVPSDLPYPVVVKSARGFGGHEVRLVKNEEALKEALQSFQTGGAVVQRLASETGRDVRAYIVGNEVVCAMQRSSKGDFRSNFGLGANASRYTLNEKERAMIARVLEHLELGLAGIDFIFHNGEPVFNEIEDVVGARMVYQYTDIDIVEVYLDHIEKACKVKKM